MATTYKATTFKTVARDGYTDVVEAVYWTARADNGAETTGVAMIAFDPEKEFVPYDELTKEIVAGWIETAVPQEERAAVDELLAAQPGASAYKTPEWEKPAIAKVVFPPTGPIEPDASPRPERTFAAKETRH